MTCRYNFDKYKFDSGDELTHSMSMVDKMMEFYSLLIELSTVTLILHRLLDELAGV